MDRNEAMTLAREMLEGLQPTTGYKLLITEDVRESEFTWVFFFTTEHGQLLGGAGPILIDKINGSVQLCGSAFPSDWYVQKYDELRKSGRPVSIEEVQLTLIEEARNQMRPEVEIQRLNRRLAKARNRAH